MGGRAAATDNLFMASALITCTTPRSMATEDAMAWLERRAEQLRRAEPVEDITVRELRPRRGNPVWLVHVVLRSDDTEEWEWLLANLTRDLRRLGMRPTIRIDERRREIAAERELLRAA